MCPKAFELWKRLNDKPLDKTRKYIGNRALKVGGKYRIKEKLHFMPSKEWITLKSKSKVLAPSRTQTKKRPKERKIFKRNILQNSKPTVFELVSFICTNFAVLGA